MNCMKCGRENSDDHAFCPRCLELMEKHPVKPDIVVQLPARREVPQKKVQPRKKVRTPQEQILILKRRNRWLIAVAVLLLVACLLLLSLCIDYFRQLDVQKFLGQNYSTVETVD